MDTSELFSHRQAPQVVNTDQHSHEPVQAPVFSDQPASIPPTPRRGERDRTVAPCIQAGPRHVGPGTGRQHRRRLVAALGADRRGTSRSDRRAAPHAGEIVDIRINWSATEGQTDLETIVTGARLMRSNDLSRRPRLMVVKGAGGCAKLLVVPSMTSQALGSIVMRVAAGLPTWNADSDSKLIDTAECVLRLAEAESAKWAAPLVS